MDKEGYYTDGSLGCHGDCLITKLHKMTELRNKKLLPFGCPDNYTQEDRDTVDGIMSSHWDECIKLLSWYVKGLNK